MAVKKLQATLQAGRRVLVIGDSFTSADLTTDTLEVQGCGSGDGVPTPDELASFDMAMVFGPLSNNDRAIELAGALKLALERSATIVVALTADPGALEKSILGTLAPGTQFTLLDDLRTVLSDPAPHPAFREYMTTPRPVKVGVQEASARS